MSIKVDFKPTELANKSTLKKQFKKIRSYYDKFFLNIDNDEWEEDNSPKKEERKEAKD